MSCFCFYCDGQGSSRDIKTPRLFHVDYHATNIGGYSLEFMGICKYHWDKHSATWGQTYKSYIAREEEL